MKGRTILPQLNPEQIKSIRKQLHMTQKEFADKIGCSKQTVSFWEQGRRHPVGSAQNSIKKLLVQHKIKSLIEEDTLE